MHLKCLRGEEVGGVSDERSRDLDIKYHLIGITKYRYPIMRGEVAERARDVIRQICQAREVTIVRGAVSPDHIHLLVSAPPLLSPAKLVQYVKGKSSRQLQEASK
jgi:putative transposase